MFHFLRLVSILAVTSCAGTTYERNALPTQNTKNNLERISQFDDGPQGVNAVTWVNPESVAISESLDHELSSTGLRSPIHGLTFLVKDNIDVAGAATTAGSAALARAVPPDDADVVAQLREAGAILLGKTNMSELALSYGRLGYSATGGLTRNPYDPRRNASGSSSGAAAAVAAGFADFALGTDTAGSIRGPAAVTGLVGMKPTHDLISLDGIIPLSPSLDVVGPIASTVRLTGLVLVEMMQPSPLQERIRNVLRQNSKVQPAESKSIGVVKPIPAGHPDVEQAVSKAITALAKSGVRIVEIDLPETRQSLWPTLDLIIDAEFGPALNHYLKSVADGPANLEMLIELSAKDGQINPARLEALRKVASTKNGPADKKVRQQLIDRLDALFAQHGLDAIVFPTIACPASPVYDAPDDRYTCDMADPYTMSYLANASSFPEITLPVGVTRHGLPIGMSFFGQAFSEDKLIELGLALERVIDPIPAPILSSANPN